jgi:hypothetical protein
MTKLLLCGWFWFVLAIIIVLITAIVFPLLVSLDSTEVIVLGLFGVLCFVLPAFAIVSIKAAKNFHKAYQLYSEQKETK